MAEEKGTVKPNCYECKYRRGIPGDAHSACEHPMISHSDILVSLIALQQGASCPIHKRMNITADECGIRGGWFAWPVNFDPTWLKSCVGFEKK